MWGGKLTPYPPHKPRFAVYSFPELASFFSLCLKVCLVRVGGTIFHVPHIPIGNPHGRAAVECIAGLSELRYVENGLLQKDGFAPFSWSFEDAIAALRYVDDLILMSKMLCLE